MQRGHPPRRLLAPSALALAALCLRAHGDLARDFAVGALSCEGVTNPGGVDTSRPRLSWILTSNRRGERQTAYQVLVASSPDALARNRGDLWDSGRVASSQSIQVEYAGKPLTSRARCWWKVRAWNRDGRPSRWSASAVWTMGLLSPRDWVARWIAAPPPPGGRLPLFRAEFRVAKPVRRADLFVCGLGAAEVHLNGRLADDALFEPGWTDYRKTCLYRALDVTSRLRVGENVLGVMLGNGMYNVVGGRYTKFTGTYGPPKVIAQLHVEYADGTRQLVRTDERWKVTPGPITFSCVYGGEDYDARLEQPGWDRPGFRAAGWAPALVTDGPGGRLTGLSRSAPPVRAMRHLAPISKRRLGPGVWVYDLGQNCSLMPRLTLTGATGRRVTIRTGEAFQGDRFIGACHDMATYNYTLRGRGAETWMPRFTYVGARYLILEGAEPEDGDRSSGLPTLHRLEGVFVSGSAHDAGWFACSNATFNRTASLVRWAMRSNMMSVLTDCPHREKLGWLEQDHLVGPSLLYSYDLQSLYRKIVGDMADAQLPDGLVPDIAPEYVVFGGGFRDSPEWGSACVLVPWQMYQWYGDTAVLRGNYDRMKRYVAYLGSKSNGLIVSHGLADWIALQPTPAPQVATAFYYLDAAVMAKVARVLGKCADALEYAALARRIRDAYNARFYDAARKQYAAGTQTANVLPVGVGIAPEADRAAIVDAVVADIRARGDALTVGEIGYPYLVRVLAAYGRSDLLCAMNTSPDHPGYGMMLARGATSLPEAWDANPNLSLNHFMLGHIVEWFYGHLAGIRRDDSAPAFRRIVIQPEPAGDVRWTRASYRSPYGEIRSAWRRTRSALRMEVRIPVNTTAVIHVPLGPKGVVRESGKRLSDAPAIGRLGARARAAIVSVGSGSYSFVSE